MSVVAVIKALHQAFSRLEEATAKAEVALWRDRALPVVLPEHPVGAAQREVAIAELTRLRHRNDGDPHIRSGIVCASPATVDAIEALNLAKAAFKETVVAFRKAQDNEKHSNHLLLRRFLEQTNESIPVDEWSDLEISFARLQWHRLDLLHCYANVRILPPDTHTVSWTWATVHSAQTVIKKERAIQLAMALDDPEKQAIALADLGKVRQNELIQFKRLPPQLRMNVMHPGGKNGRSTAYTVSGILIQPNTRLPEYIWRPAPVPDTHKLRRRVKRSDAALSAEPCVPLLHLYLRNHD